MSKFKARATPLRPVESREDMARFTKGAPERAAAVAPSPTHDPNAKPNTGLSLRLNEYQLEMIRDLAKLEQRSIQKLLMGILIPELERRHTAMLKVGRPDQTGLDRTGPV